MAYIKYFTNSFGRRIFTTSTVSLNNGAISSSLNPAMPQPILVTRNVSGGLPGPSDEFIHIGSDRIHTTLHRGDGICLPMKSYAFSPDRSKKCTNKG